MSLDQFPPQAYTKETLLKAYNWLQSQPESVRDLASTPDQLVSLYLKNSRGSSLEGLERPSIQSFKSELKNLAGMMGDLEKKQDPPYQASQQQTPPYQAPQHQVPPYQQSQQSQRPQVPVTPQWDEVTQTLIREVKSELNLSSDQEALRMLVKIGYQKVRSLYK
ncbi:MAG: hypothetical protein ACK5V3_06030 [Bdellovibrionales bacterium]